MIALQYNEITIKTLTQNGNKCNSYNNKIEHINPLKSGLAFLYPLKTSEKKEKVK